MLSGSNIGVLVGGLVTDPETLETKNGRIFKFRVGADRAGSNQGKVDSGYFDVVYFDKEVDESPSSTFIRRQVQEGKMSKGSQITILYRLNQERWKTEGGENRSKVTLIADSIEYVRTAAAANRTENTASEPTVEAQAPEINLPAAW